MARSRKHLIIKTPKVSAFRVTNASGDVSVQLKWNPQFKPQKELAFQNAQAFVDSECLRYMNPLTPRLTGFMIESATLGTDIGSGEIEYLASYARRQYYEHKEKSHWFEAMKAAHKETIQRGANRITGGGSGG